MNTPDTSIEWRFGGANAKCRQERQRSGKSGFFCHGRLQRNVVLFEVEFISSASALRRLGIELRVRQVLRHGNILPTRRRPRLPGAARGDHLNITTPGCGLQKGLE